ncbi:MAG: ribbon-helix-helix domain-containing protein [Actinobacteria bacterium]|nr:ribbon-helix-helix domain-containing protein [Actinomycetota bacterium]
MPAELAEEVTSIAEQRGVSVSTVAREALAKYVKRGAQSSSLTWSSRPPIKTRDDADAFRDRSATDVRS